MGARARIDRINDAWTKLLDPASGFDRPDEAVAAQLHGELDAVKSEASSAGWRDVLVLASKLEELVFLAHRHHYDVPMELLLTVSMAVEFLGTLVDAPSADHRSDDLPGFLDQLDAVLRETAALPARSDRSPVPPATRSSPATAANVVRLEPDRLGSASRQRLAAAATNIYLESIRTRGATSLRLRETWAILRRELGDLGRVALAPSLHSHVEPTERLALDHGKSVQILCDLAEVSVSPEIGALAEAAVSHLLHNTIVHGIEARSARSAAAKPTQGIIRLASRLADGVVTITVEDDGAGREDAGDQDYLAELRRRLGRDGGSLVLRAVPGRGTAATITLVDSTLSVAVRTFRSSNDHLLLAVDTSWALLQEWHRATPLDPVAALGLRVPDEVATTHTAVFRRGDVTYELPVRSIPNLSAATRICPTAADALVEVVVIGEQEALLLRLDRLATPGAQSTVPPNAIPTRTTVTSPPATQRSERRARTAHNVLLLDTNATWLVLTRAALLHRGFEVQVVTSLTALGEVLEQSPPHIVLADTEKLDISAEELCRRVKQVRPLLPVLLFADMGAAELARIAEHAHADGSLSKSVGPDELARTLEARLS